MAKLWAIAIGINQYQNFQPLSYAQADAEALTNFLIQQAGFSEAQCLLMTDSSAPVGNQPTVPTKNNILQLLEDLAANSWQPQDKIWCFFSGYGINYEGQDYLMPIDGNSQRISETAIEIRQLMQTFQVAELEVLLMLDFNRAFGTQADSFVGQETIELAQELQISTILSCQPQQFSHESSELGHGFFTAALLEALRYGNINNLAGLENYLSLRTPELCQHHWRPTQNPVSFILSPQQALFEQQQVKNDTEELPILDSRETFTARSAPKLEEQPVDTDNNNNLQPQEVVTDSSSASKTLADSPISIADNQNTQAKVKSKNYQPLSLLFWGTGVLIAGGLLLVVFLRFEEIFQTSSNRSDNVTIVKPLPNNRKGDNSNLPQTNQAMLELENMSLNATQASDLNKAIAAAKNIPPSAAGYKQARKNIKIWSSMILDLAKNRAENMQYTDAIAAAQLISQEESNYREAQNYIKQWQTEAKQYFSNQILLEAAQALIKPNQASTYNRAIEVAKRVPPSEPGFAMAQTYIERWSQNILQLAKNRASQKQYSSAIATATLAPEGTAAYAEAQDLIQQWQKFTN